jgi:hypothetical protein
MTPPAETIARDQIFVSLAPFFLEAAKGNATDARAAAEAMVNSFGPETSEQTLLAAQIVVYSLAGLDSLRRSAEAPDIAPSVHLRLRGNANAMQRASQNCRKAFDMRRKGTVGATPATQVRTFTEDDLKAAIQSASAVIAEARAAAQTPMNREARRAAERQARRSMRTA